MVNLFRILSYACCLSIFIYLHCIAGAGVGNVHADATVCGSNAVWFILTSGFEYDELETKRYCEWG